MLARLRWSFLLFIVFFVITFIPQLTLGSDRPPWQQACAVIALVGLGAWYVHCYRVRRFPLIGVPLELVAFVLVVVTPDDPYTALGLLYITVNFRAFYGTWRHVLMFTVLALAAFSGAVEAVALTGGPDRVELLLQSIPGVPVLAVIAHLAAVACERGERAAARERVLSRSGAAIALAVVPATVIQEALEAVSALTAGVPGLTATVETPPPAQDSTISAQRRPATSPSVGSVTTREPHEPQPGHDLVLPLRTHGTAVGTLAIHSATELPDEVRDALEALASQVAMGLHTASLTADLRRRATVDALTGLANRSLLEERLQTVLHATGCPDVALLLLDLDGFKAVNDTMGHHAGDLVLVEAARRMRELVDPRDLVVRLGGDEFVVLIHRAGRTDGTDRDGARAGVAEGAGLGTAEQGKGVAERVASQLAPQLTVALLRPVVLDDGRPVRVGASVGTATAAAGTTPHQLLRAADSAMYAVKASRARPVPVTPAPVGAGT